MKFTVKGLIALFVTSSTLFLMPMRSDAKVNMKTLAEVADSCQKDVFSESYYQKMRLNFSNEVSDYFQSCIAYRYQYSLVLDKFPWLAYKEEIMPGYPGSVVVAILALDGTTLLDCIASRVAPSEELCSILIALGYRIQDRYIGDWKIYGVGYFAKYLIYVCPSCVVAHDEVSGSKEVILKAFIEWVLKLSIFSRSGFTEASETLAGFVAPQTILLWGGEEIKYSLENECIRRALIKKYRICVEQGLANYNIKTEVLS